MPDPIPVVTLGRLAVDKLYHSRGYGRGLIKDAAQRVTAAADQIGIRGLIVHAFNEEARAYYLRRGFLPSPTNDMTLMIPLGYLSRYTHRVAISNSRLMRFDQTGVTFRYKDYRQGGADRQQTMTLAADEFIRRFLLHVLPKGFHRIRHYGLLAGATRKVVLNQLRQLLGVTPPATTDAQAEPNDIRPPCPCCGGHMVVIETFERQRQPRAPPALVPPSGTQPS